ncbi:nucleotidyltransferase domain-containing protein, partial [Candidatus Woesearchaeota archaeon]|nr:nucleotidyltransferase domain-containing protein [Candidatus Woesearchaeota archaeon]
ILKDELSDRIRAVLLFGSFSDKTYTSRSDIDICAVFRAISLKEATEFRISVSGQLPEKVDVQVFDVLPQKIKREIARNNKVLYRAKDYDKYGRIDDEIVFDAVREELGKDARQFVERVKNLHKL